MQLNKKIISISLLVVLSVIVILAVMLNREDSKPQTSIVNNEIINEQFIAKDADIAEHALTTYESLAGAKIEIPGTSPISQNNQVMTYTGEVTDNSAEPGSSLSPKSALVDDNMILPSGTFQLEVSANGFFPNEITVESGQPVTISLTSIDGGAHVIAFSDPKLKGINFGVIGGETRAMTFNAPETGSYQFFCQVPGHKDRGEEGVMIVR